MHSQYTIFWNNQPICCRLRSLSVAVMDNLAVQQGGSTDTALLASAAMQMQTAKHSSVACMGSAMMKQACSQRYRWGSGCAHHFDDITGADIADVTGEVLDAVPQTIHDRLPLPRHSHSRQILRLSITCAAAMKGNQLTRPHHLTYSIKYDWLGACREGVRIV